MTDEQERKLINLNTGITLGAAMAVMSGVLWVNTSVNTIKAEQIRAAERAEAQLQLFRLETNNQLGALRQQIESASIDRWTGSDMRKWITQLRDKNPTLVVPDGERK